MSKLTTIREILVPEKGRYINSPLQYFRQSRFFLWTIFMLRALFFLTLRGFKFEQIKVDETSKHNDAVIAHNLWENFAVFNFSRGRIEFLLWPLRLVPSVKLYGKTLCIGPKNEGELLCYWAHGFKFKNISGADLFSYSPKIKVTDLHDLKFPDNSFDTISCGWVLKYCYDLKKAISEIVRVAKDGALITLGFTVESAQSMKNNEWVANQVEGGLEQVLELFGKNIGHIYWNCEDLKDGRGKGCLVFKIKKSST